MALNVGELFGTLRLDTSRFTSALRDAQRNMQNAENNMEGMGRSASIARVAIEGMALALAAAAAAAAAVTYAGVKMNASAEQSQVAFEGLLGSAERAELTIARLTKFAKTTPFEYEGIEKASISLLNAGVKSSDLQDTLTKLGDAVSVSGGNIQEKLEGVSTAIGQMLSKGKISAEEMQQLAERGLPAWDALAKQVGKSKEELMKLSEQGKLSAEFIPDLIEGLGSRSQGAMQKQSQTMTGLFSTMIDSIKIILKDMTKGPFMFLKERLKEINESLDKVGSTFEGFYYVFTLNGALTWMVELLTDVVKWFGEVFKKVGEGDSFQKLIYVFKDFFEKIGQIFSSDLITGVLNIVFELITVIVSFINQLLPLLSDLFNWLGKIVNTDAFKETVVGIVQIIFFLRALLSWIPKAVNWIKGLWASITATGAVTSRLGAFWNTVKAVAQNGIFWLKFLAGYIVYVIGLFVATVDGAVNGWAVAWNAIQQIAILAVIGVLTIIDKLALGIPGLLGLGSVIESLTDKMDNLAAEAEAFGEIGLTKNFENWKKAGEDAAKQAYITKQLQEKEIARKEELIKQAKLGTESAITEIKRLAEQGSVMALEALAEIDAAYFNTLLKTKEKQRNIMKQELEIMMGMYRLNAQGQKALGPFLPTGTKEERAKMKQDLSALENTILLMQKLSDEYGTVTTEVTTTGVGGGDTRTAAEKQFEAFKQMIEDKKAFDELTLRQEISMFEKHLTRYTKNSADQIAIRKEMNQTLYSLRSEYLSELDKQGREEIDRQKELGVTTYKLASGKVMQFENASKREIYALQIHYNKMKIEYARMTSLNKKASKESLTTAKQALLDARLEAINETLSDEWREIQDEINTRNDTEIKGIEKFYEDKAKAIDEGIKKLEDAFASEDIKEKRTELLEELAFIEGSIDKEALERAKEIKKELRQLDRDEQIAAAKEKADKEKADLEEEKDRLLEAQKLVNENRLKEAEKAFEAQSIRYRKMSQDLTKSTQSITAAIDAESTKVEKAGTNMISKLINALKNLKQPLQDEINAISNILKKAGFGDFGATAAVKVAGLDTTKMANPMPSGSPQQTVIFNAPLLTVQNMNMNDKLDVKVVATEMFTAAGNVIKAGGTQFKGAY